jgi:hypothetical protein
MHLAASTRRAVTPQPLVILGEFANQSAPAVHAPLYKALHFVAAGVPGDAAMGFIDFIVNRSFRDEPQGRVVVFNGVSRGRGYLVRSASEELRIRAFLKMYLFAEFAIQMLGTLLVAAWLSSLFGASGRPTLERELARGGYFLAAYALVVGLPFFFLWRAYRQAVLSFVSPGDAVAVAPRPMDRTQRITLAVIAVVVVAVAVTIVALVRVR